MKSSMTEQRQLRAIQLGEIQRVDSLDALRTERLSRETDISKDALRAAEARMGCVSSCGGTAEVYNMTSRGNPSERTPIYNSYRCP